jgi:hypothetical protein
MAPHDLNGSSDHSNGTNGHYATVSTGTAPAPTTTTTTTTITTAIKTENGSTSTIKLSDRLAVHRSPKAFGSYAYSLVSLPAGALFSPITGTTSGVVKAYSSVQTGPDSHIELNSELVFCNQSCDPSLEFDMASFEVRVSRKRALEKGDALTFWYPSTEWEMAQPFKCECGSEKCKGYINGAGQMDETEVREYWLNAHIENLLAERAASHGNGQ